MSAIELTAYQGSILGPIAKFLGWIMDGIYNVLYQVFGVQSVVVSIIILTILIYMCLLPLTIKQQKFSKLSQKMQPEMNAIREKYKNKKDQASAMAMQQETQLVYEKYGVSPTGSCVQMLIQFPILLALYRVFYNIPGYISSIRYQLGVEKVGKDFVAVKNGIVDGIINSGDDYLSKLSTLMSDYKVVTSSGLNSSNVVDKLSTLASNGDQSGLNNYIVDILYKLPSEAWTNAETVDFVTGNIFSRTTNTVDTLMAHFSGLEDVISDTFSKIGDFNYLLGLNISDTPWNIINSNFLSRNWLLLILALMIPVISYLTQVISIKMMPAPASNGNDATANQMKTMNTMMPLFSLFLCFTVPVGLGIYWIFSAVVRSVQQFFINKHMENLDLDDIIAKNQEKARIKREKRGITEEKMRAAAAMNTRTIGNKANILNGGDDSERESALEHAEEVKKNAVSGSMASKANLVRDFNERNNRK